jgi:DtxR family Mn-dependent transcriptional regulator
MPTVSVENYLKSIYHLEGQGDERVKTKDLARELDISHSSVTSMLKSLADDGLIDYEPYRGARLTDRGIESALNVIRNHRLIEIFLVKALGYAWDEVHDEAERLEHAMSDKLADRIDEYLGRPEVDPHGDPIPTAEGEISDRDAVPLDDIDEGASVRIERVLDQEPEVLRYLESVGLTPSTRLEVDEVIPIDGQMTIRIDDETRTVSKSLASRLLVTKITDEI